MKDTLSIQEIIQTLKKRMVLIIGIAAGLVLIVALLSYYVLPSTYQSSSQFIVIEQQNENIQFSMSHLETNLELINTYKEIISSPFILEKVITELNLSIPLDDLQKDIEITSGDNSQVVTVSAIGPNLEEAALLANTVVNQFRSNISDIMPVENVFVLSEANPALSQKPIAPRPMMNMIIASIVGMATGIGLALFLELVNTKVKVERDIEELGIPVLGVVSTMNKHKPNRRKRKLSSNRKEEKRLDAQEG
ncbi:capsular biosynthesis protein [Ornithinibacillus sp. BX22]|uniref:Capsular biosynthesis protein n=2 Tax=Ornithinibacillus TaxID=484508 RepID=A0A923L7S1_9BACI|nr:MULTISPECIES: Wzz/FepE/Etk N-terminal domain-containing protein [Ornithinibacillus]MBC5637994.1 capsular biosynthesis protein [Ornithinibacillus hominis]MBS3681882.1 capsular biosynthesis protein [Ornithinibacillus massiliensis]